jgi:hypothetical protein
LATSVARMRIGMGGLYHRMKESSECRQRFDGAPRAPRMNGSALSSLSALIVFAARRNVVCLTVMTRRVTMAGSRWVAGGRYSWA